MSYVYTFYVNDKEIDLNVRDETDISADVWDKMSDDEKDAVLSELFEQERNSLANMGWYEKDDLDSEAIAE